MLSRFKAAATSLPENFKTFVEFEFYTQFHYATIDRSLVEQDPCDPANFTEFPRGLDWCFLLLFIVWAGFVRKMVESFCIIVSLAFNNSGLERAHKQNIGM